MPVSGYNSSGVHKNIDSESATFNDCTFNQPYRIWSGDWTFNNCTFVPSGSSYMQIDTNATATFHNCTWDASNSRTNKFLEVQSGSSVTFTETQTKIAPEDGRSFSWGLLSTAS